MTINSLICPERDEEYKYAYGGIEHFNFNYEIHPEGRNEWRG